MALSLIQEQTGGSYLLKQVGHFFGGKTWQPGQLKTLRNSQFLQVSSRLFSRLSSVGVNAVAYKRMLAKTGIQRVMFSSHRKKETEQTLKKHWILCSQKTNKQMLLEYRMSSTYLIIFPRIRISEN